MKCLAPVADTNEVLTKLASYLTVSRPTQRTKIVGIGSVVLDQDVAYEPEKPFPYPQVQESVPGYRYLNPMGISHRASWVEAMHLAKLYSTPILKCKVEARKHANGYLWAVIIYDRREYDTWKAEGRV